MNRFFPAALALVLTFPLAAESLTYRETSQGKTTKEIVTITRIDEAGLSWEVAVGKDSTNRMGKTAAGVMMAVEVVAPDGQWALKNEGDALKASGTYQGKAVTGSLVLKGRFWTLGFDQPLKWAVTHKLTSPMTFLMVNPIAVSQPTEMVLIPDGKDTVEGKPALRYKISLSGAMALFWGAMIWADPVTGDELQYKGNKGPGTPDMVLVIDRNP